MKAKKLLSGLLACSMIAAATPAFAATPWEYDNQSYESRGLLSEDPDGEINLAVIANGDVEIGNGASIGGSVYSNGKIYVKDFIPSDEHVIDPTYIEDDYPWGDPTPEEIQAPEVKGMFISGVQNDQQYVVDSDEQVYLDGYYLYNDGDNELYNGGGDASAAQKPNYAGGVYDGETSFNCEYTPFEIPQIDNEITTSGFHWSDETFTIDFNNAKKHNTVPITISEDTYIECLYLNTQGRVMGGIDEDVAGITIDTSKNDVTLVINKIANQQGNRTIKVIGDHEAYIYINNFSYKQSDPAYNINHNDNYVNGVYYPEFGNPEHTHLFISGDEVNLRTSHISAAEVKINTNTLRLGRNTKIWANEVSTNAKNVEIHHTGYVNATLCAPYADTQIIQQGTLEGQLHTNTLKINTLGKIIYAEDQITKVTPTEEPTEEPKLPPSGDEISLKGVGYAYIFGYEPDVQIYDDGTIAAEIEMGPDDDVTREQVAAMFMRLLDQNNNTKGETYPMTDNIAWCDGQWFARGLAYLSSKGAFDGMEFVGPGEITRGEVAKLLVYALNLSNTAEADFTDISGNPYEEYIKIANAYGYMTGNDDGTFTPDYTMTRAEFCAMFNKITGRNNWGLETTDGEEVTTETYSIVDLAGHWGEEDMLKATSAYTKTHLIDLETRHANMRNILDNYDGQQDY